MEVKGRILPKIRILPRRHLASNTAARIDRLHNGSGSFEIMCGVEASAGFSRSRSRSFGKAFPARAFAVRRDRYACAVARPTRRAFSEAEGLPPAGEVVDVALARRIREDL